jgi:hypothetical protein
MRGSDSEPETCHPRVLRNKYFERVCYDRLWPGLPVQGHRPQQPLDSARIERPVFDSTSSTSRPLADIRSPQRLMQSGRSIRPCSARGGECQNSSAKTSPNTGDGRGLCRSIWICRCCAEYRTWKPLIGAPLPVSLPMDHVIRSQPSSGDGADSDASNWGRHGRRGLPGWHHHNCQMRRNDVPHSCAAGARRRERTEGVLGRGHKAARTLERYRSAESSCDWRLRWA